MDGTCRTAAGGRSLNQVVLVLAVTCGFAVANLYYAQPLLDPIAAGLHVAPSRASIVLVVTQLGYATGMLLLAPLGDMLENRRLACRVLLACSAALAVAAAAPSLTVFVAASLAVGATSVVAQILVPVAAHIAPERHRGQIVGRVMTGLLLGILLARTASSLVTAALGWRAVYATSAVVMLLLAGLLTRLLPRRVPDSRLGYRELLASLWSLAREERVLRRRALYQSLMFASFSVFWTGIASELVARHGLDQVQVGLFALVGAAGAAAAPVAGRLGDRGHSRPATGAAFALAAASLLLAALQAGSVAALAAAGVGLDLAVQTSLVLGQRAIYSVRPEARSRMNTVYITTFFLGGALGSALSGFLYQAGGWTAAALAGAALPALGLLLWAWHARTSTPPEPARAADAPGEARPS